MRKHEKTQSKLNKILLVLLIAAFIYTCFGIEFSDLSWKTNGKTYKVLLSLIAIFIGMSFDYWYLKRKQKQS
jgi:RsiW-degrading membrane proteinase PrsW (M82 family)